MLTRRSFLAALPVAFAAASLGDAAEKKKKKMSAHDRMVKQFDKNGDGQLRGNEEIAARAAKAQLRQKRALRRNKNVINSIL